MTNHEKFEKPAYRDSNILEIFSIFRFGSFTFVRSPFMGSTYSVKSIEKFLRSTFLGFNSLKFGLSDSSTFRHLTILSLERLYEKVEMQKFRKESFSEFDVFGIPYICIWSLEFRTSQRNRLKIFLNWSFCLLEIRSFKILFIYSINTKMSNLRFGLSHSTFSVIFLVNRPIWLIRLRNEIVPSAYLGLDILA